LRSSVIYASRSTRSSIVASPSRLCQTAVLRRNSGAESPTPDRVLTRRRRTGPTITFSLRSFVRRVRHIRQRLFSENRPSARQRISKDRSRKSSIAAAKQRAVGQPLPGVITVTGPPPPPLAVQSPPVPISDESTDLFVDVPLNDSAFLTWSTVSVLSEKRVSL
jgi:hypothetical protein